MLAGVAGVILGWVWGGFQPLIGLGIIGEPSVTNALVFPINKMLWTSSYVLYTAGLAFLSLATCLWLVDLGRRAADVPRWTMPFVVLGTNAIFAYLASGLAAKLLHVWTVAAERRHPHVRVGLGTGARVRAAHPVGCRSRHSCTRVSTRCCGSSICGWMYKRRIFLKL